MSKSGVQMLLEQLEIHYQEDEWFVSMERALEGVTAAQAAIVPTGSNNTIWQIVNHLVHSNEGVVHRLRGTVNPNPAKDNDETFGEPGDPSDEAGWGETLGRLRSVMCELKQLLTEMDDERLLESYRENSPPVRRLLSNIMMHDTYHVGQIVILRKLQGSWNPVHW